MYYYLSTLISFSPFLIAATRTLKITHATDEPIWRTGVGVTDLREWTHGHSRGRRGWDRLREQHWDIHITRCERESQWSHCATEECSLRLCDDLEARGGKEYNHVYTYSWFILIHGRNQHNTAKQLSSN